MTQRKQKAKNKKDDFETVTEVMLVQLQHPPLKYVTLLSEYTDEITGADNWLKEAKSTSI